MVINCYRKELLSGHWSSLSFPPCGEKGPLGLSRVEQKFVPWIQQTWVCAKQMATEASSNCCVGVSLGIPLPFSSWWNQLELILPRSWINLFWRDYKSAWPLCLAVAENLTLQSRGLWKLCSGEDHQK